MSRWDKSLRQDRHRHGKENPSFSSTLLDAIYRSIDEGNGEGEEELIFYRETMRKKHGGAFQEDEMASLRQACMIEKWMEKKVSEKVVVLRKSVADFSDRDSMFLKSSSSSSESSCGGGFSSSETESVYGVKSRQSSAMQRPKPIRTSVSARPERFEKPRNEFYAVSDERNYAQTQKPKHEGGGGFVKTKSRALKIYGDLKKVKQPISPGGRLASFLNSLFSAGAAKKAKISSSSVGVDDDTSSERKSKSAHASTCSSASSFSRSCLSKTPSSRGKLSNGAKRSVRFYPVSVILDEDSQPCGHKSLMHEDERSFKAVPIVRNSFNHQDLNCHVVKENRRVEENTRDLLKNYQRNDDFDMKDVHNDDEVSENDDYDDDAGSCSSSDLFELDNLSAIGIDRYREELPVYETTHLDTNRAIASGLIL
ncbi:hypothetical protein L1049_005165 [Liquidambar formosana]|uniref:Protein BIG GRAIN 1-like B n=1 Tax=Liquidambar formosana TaxID=63359 RepID=A0AAP0WZ13_LIQFO